MHNALCLINFSLPFSINQLSHLHNKFFHCCHDVSVYHCQQTHKVIPVSSEPEGRAPTLGSENSAMAFLNYVPTSHLGLVSTKMPNVSVSSWSQTCASRISSRSQSKTSRRLVSGLGPFRLVETFHAGVPNLTTILQ